MVSVIVGAVHNNTFNHHIHAIFKMFKKIVFFIEKMNKYVMVINMNASTLNDGIKQYSMKIRGGNVHINQNSQVLNNEKDLPISNIFLFTL